MKTVVLTAVAALAVQSAWAATYEIDKVHSEVGFKVRHMMVGKTTGRFRDFSGAFEFDGDRPKQWTAKATIAAASIDTADAKRDEHLRAPDFFDVEKHRAIEFTSTGVSGWRDGKGKLHGQLTMHGVTRPVVLDLEFNGETTDPWGAQRAGFSAKTKVDRRDFGIVWNKALDKGGLAVGNDVEITLDIEGVKKDAASKQAKR
ncbi:MAG: YceI family protein [Elusimicrobia bacterium]|nr:YceI family protein [Elusimicrobiota bacterium]